MTDGQAQGFVTEYLAVRATGNPYAPGEVEKFSARGGKITRETVFFEPAPPRAASPLYVMKRLPVAADGTLGHW
jgi:hypothetical protein